jgi:hypothetical protein
MKTATAFLCLTVLLITYPVTSVAGENAPAVVVELFTSEACSSCPPADALLSKLREKHVVNGAELLVLGEHVDYFNHTGWNDRFSSHLFTERQNIYARRFHLAGPYTPEIAIDGHWEAVGSDEASVGSQIYHAVLRVAGSLHPTATAEFPWTLSSAIYWKVGFVNNYIDLLGGLVTGSRQGPRTRVRMICPTMNGAMGVSPEPHLS